ncbi:uncharacterized protein LOC144108025 [Amblyomma americanum]
MDGYNMDGYILLACFVLSELLKFSSSHIIPAPRPLPAGFKMNVKYKSWLIKDTWSCTLTGDLRTHDQENQLYINCHSSDISRTKFYDFVKDVLLQEDGKTGELKLVKGIPEAEKQDPDFPVAFTKEGNHKVFQKHFSLLRLAENSEEPVKESSIGATNEEAAETVNIQGESYQCTKQVIYTDKSAVSHYCDGRKQTRVPCPVIPEDVRLDCGPKKTIHYYITHYEEQCDRSIIQPYLEKLKMKNLTLEPIPPLVPGPVPPSAGLSPGTMVPIMIASALIIGLSLNYLVKWWKSRSTKKIPPSSPAAGDVDHPASPATSNFSDASDCDPPGPVQVCPAENGDIAVRFHPQLLHRHQDRIGSSGDDIESRENSQREEFLLGPGNCEERPQLDDQTSNVSSGRHLARVQCAESLNVRGGEQMQPTKKFSDRTARIHSRRGPVSGQALLGNVSTPTERAHYSRSKLRKSQGQHPGARNQGQEEEEPGSFRDKPVEESPKKRTMGYKEQDSSSADIGAQMPLLGKDLMDVPCLSEARTGQGGQP